MTEFAKYLVDTESSVEGLDLLTKDMNEQIKTTIFPREKKRWDVSHFFREIPLIRHVCVAVIAVIGGYAVGYLGYYNAGVSIDNAYVVSVTVGLGILAIYAESQRKK